jgi:hypothetical protein
VRKLLREHRQREADVEIGPVKQHVELGNVLNSPVSPLVTAYMELFVRKPQILPSQIEGCIEVHKF